MKRDWLWDRKTPLKKARSILKKPDHEKFIALAALLLSRKNNPKEVFRMLSEFNFVRNWAKIKARMRRDYWNLPRITFWQAIYEKAKEQLSKKGVEIEIKIATPPEKMLIDAGRKIREIRKNKKMSQADLAKKLKISQQLISRVEQGRENISLLTLSGMVKSLGMNLKLEFGA